MFALLVPESVPIETAAEHQLARQISVRERRERPPCFASRASAAHRTDAVLSESDSSLSTEHRPLQTLFRSTSDQVQGLCFLFEGLGC